MFDTLTPDERLALYSKLGAWAHEFAEVGRPLSYVALANHGTDTCTILWTQRDRYYEIMNELHDAMKELAV